MLLVSNPLPCSMSEALLGRFLLVSEFNSTMFSFSMSFNNWSVVRDGVIAITPLSVAVIPWGILTGALAMQAGLNSLQAQSLSLFVFAGAAQLSGIGMMAAAVPAPSILGSTAVISARHLLYSMVFRSHVEGLRWPMRAGIAFVLTDEMFVVSEAHTKRTGSFSALYALSAGITFYLVWNLATYGGIVAGEHFSDLESMGLDFAIVATFIAMTFDQIKSKPEVVTVLIAGVSAVLLEPLLPDSYILVATMLGMISGYLKLTFSGSKRQVSQ